VGDVGVGEDDLVDVLLADEARERALVVDRDAVRITVAGELFRIGAVVDERIWVAVKATTWYSGRPRYATLKLWKSRPAAPMMRIRRGMRVLSGKETGV
jgi:hypothetical protein